LGRVYKKEEIYDGLFYKGDYWNLGIKIHLNKNTFTFGYFEKSAQEKSLQIGKGYPSKLIGYEFSSIFID